MVNQKVGLDYFPLATSCRRCNRKKKDKDLNVFLKEICNKGKNGRAKRFFHIA